MYSLPSFLPLYRLSSQPLPSALLLLRNHGEKGPFPPRLGNSSNMEGRGWLVRLALVLYLLVTSGCALSKLHIVPKIILGKIQNSQLKQKTCDSYAGRHNPAYYVTE